MKIIKKTDEYRNPAKNGWSFLLFMESEHSSHCEEVELGQTGGIVNV